MKRIFNYIINCPEIIRINREIRQLNEDCISCGYSLHLAKNASKHYRDNIYKRLMENHDRIHILNRRLRMLKNGL